MTVTRKNIEFAKRILADRVGNPYVYGGNWDPYNLATGTDCSGLCVDELDAAVNGTAMAWTRHGLSTESWRPVEVGQTGPFGTICVASPNDFPADAAVKIAIHHGPGGGANSHMWCEVDGVRGESNGSAGCVTGDRARSVYDTSYANDWHYLPGPIAEDGTPQQEAAVTDTLFADVSEFQAPVDDSYPYEVLSIRSNDGTYRDHNFAQNYAWMRTALDSGRLKAGIVYFYWRTNWQAAVSTCQDMVNSNGGLHPKVILMIDVERGGNPSGDFSDALNATDDALVSWTGDGRRVIAYGNTSDLNSMWPNRREDQFVVAGYGSNPSFPGKIAHQYTDGNGYGGGLPEGCSPFGNCDMNSADGLDPAAFAAACGIQTGGTVAFQHPSNDVMVQEIWDQLRGPEGAGWPQLGGLTLVDAIAKLINEGK